MNKIILFICLLPFLTQGQTTLTFTAKAQDTLGPGRSWQVWMHHAWNNSLGNGVSVGGTEVNAYDYYYRFAWWEIETNTQGVYDWTQFDLQIKRAMDNHQKFGFGVMPIFIGGSIVGGVAGLTYPTYLHTAMQAETVKDWQNAATSNYWIPNWNSTTWLARAKALLNAIAAHITGTSYTPSWSGSPILFSKVIAYVDIRMFGDFGEWHNCCYLNQTPAGAKATQATLDSIISFHVSAFPNYQLLAMCNGFDGGNPTSTAQPAQTSYYLLTGSNNFGQFGWRRDAWGEPGGDNSLSNNPYSYNGQAFAPLITGKYLFAPVGGEPSNNSGATTVGGTVQGDLAREITLYHTNFIGNENFGAMNAGLQGNVRTNSVSMGYNLKLIGGSMTTTLSPSGTFNLTVNWRNDGNTPTYENWTVKVQLRDHTTHAVVFTGTSTFNPKPLAPGSTLTQNDNFTLGAIPTGTYDLYEAALDPNGYRLPLALMITGRGSDGYYPVRTSITVSGSSSVPPFAEAGGPFSITLPNNQVTADGSASFANGGATITAYAWTNISGPNTASITSPTLSITPVTGLIAGTYKLKLTVTDNNANTAVDTLVITVNAASTTVTSVFINQLPTGTLQNDGQGVNLGMKFKSSIDALVAGVRFYKQLGNNGVHVGELYDRNGNRLAQANFTSETSSGWQTVLFSQPVLIGHDSTYIVSYFSPLGLYAEDDNFFTSATINNTLMALADGQDGHNGIYTYANSPAFPSSYFSDHKPTYWVDPIVYLNVGSSCGVNCLYNIIYNKVK